MATHPAKSFLSALGTIALRNVDLETLQNLEQSSEFDYYLDPAAPGTLHTLVKIHMKSKPGCGVRISIFFGHRHTKFLPRMIDL